MQIKAESGIIRQEPGNLILFTIGGGACLLVVLPIKNNGGVKRGADRKKAGGYA
jgi:hypothetical protein